MIFHDLFDLSYASIASLGERCDWAYMLVRYICNTIVLFPD